jgi:hypothetical protein
MTMPSARERAEGGAIIDVPPAVGAGEEFRRTADPLLAAFT